MITQEIRLAPPRSPTIVGKAVITTRVSIAERNVPSSRPPTISQIWREERPAPDPPSSVTPATRVPPGHDEPFENLRANRSARSNPFSILCGCQGPRLGPP